MRIMTNIDVGTLLIAKDMQKQLLGPWQRNPNPNVTPPPVISRIVI